MDMLSRDPAKSGGDSQGRRAGWGNGPSSTFAPHSDRFRWKRSDLKVLVLDPYALVRSTLAGNIWNAGHNPLEAESIQVALEKARLEKPAIIVVNVEAIGAEPSKIQMLKAASPGAKIIVLDGGYARDIPDRKPSLMEAGANVVLGEAEHGTVLETIEALMPASSMPLEERITAAPQTPAASARETVAIGAGKAKTHATILVVDDEPQMREVMESALKAFGYTAICEVDGTKGLEAYKTAFEAGAPFDVVISDRQMPGMCGADMVRGIRTINPDAKVIFLTGYADESDLIPLKAVKPFAILEKPVSIGTLTKTLEQALSA